MLIEQIQSRLEYIKGCDLYETRKEINKLIEIIKDVNECHDLLQVQNQLDKITNNKNSQPINKFINYIKKWTITKAI